MKNKTQKRQLLRKYPRHAVKMFKFCEIKRGVTSSLSQAIRERKLTVNMNTVFNIIDDNDEVLVSLYTISDEYSMDSSRKKITTGP
jgi:hypothetical protein